MSNKDPKITIVIPVKNEEGNIINVLEAIRKKVTFPHQILVVDGRSIDKTQELVKNYHKAYKNVDLLVTRPQDSAFKESLFVGYRSAKTEFVATFMGDLSDNPATLNKMYDKLRSGYDVVIASRYIKGGGVVNKPKMQAIISRCVSASLRLITSIPIHDVSNPFTLYRKSILTEMDIVSDANEIPIEMVYRAYFSGAKIAEVPTIWKGRVAGKSKFKMFRVVPGYAKLYLWVVTKSAQYRLMKT